MTVVRLAGRELLLHSPIAATTDLLGEISALGRVAYIVAPNRFHHLFVAQWTEAYPDASVYVAPGLEKKRSDLTISGVLTDDPEPGWAGTMDQALMLGFPLANEVVFFHRPSATLVATDLAFNIGANSGPLTRFVFRVSGAYGRLAPTLLERVLVRDRPAFARSLRKVLEWPFERVVVAHGDVSEREGRAQLERGYSWLLGES